MDLLLAALASPDTVSPALLTHFFRACLTFGILALWLSHGANRPFTIFHDMDQTASNINISADGLMFRGFCATFFLLPLGTSPFLACAFLTLSVWLLSGQFLRDSRLWLGEKWVLPVLAYIVCHWAGLLYTHDLSAGLKFAMKTHYWVFAFAMLSVPFNKYPPRALVDSLLAGLAVAALLHICMNAGVIPASEKYRAGFINPITYMLFLTFGLVLLAYFFGKAKVLRDRLLYGAGMLLYLASLSLFSGEPGRTALVSLMAMTPLIVYNLLGQRSPLKVLAATALAGGALFFLPVVQTSLADTVSQVRSYYSGDPNTSIGLRLHMWSGAMRIFLAHPLAGVGTGGYELAMAKYSVPLLDPMFRLSQPHNSFLYMAVSFGVLGIATLLWLFFALLRAAWMKRRGLPGFASLSFTLIMIVASLTDTQIIQVHSGMLLAMLTGLHGASDHNGSRGGEDI